jgi:hypothetical protein
LLASRDSNRPQANIRWRFLGGMSPDEDMEHEFEQLDEPGSRFSLRATVNRQGEPRIEQLILFTCYEFLEQFDCSYWSFKMEGASISCRRIATPLMISGRSM